MDRFHLKEGIVSDYHSPTASKRTNVDYGTDNMAVLSIRELGDWELRRSNQIS
jgi:hypothetical protein